MALAGVQIVLIVPIWAASPFTQSTQLQAAFTVDVRGAANVTELQKYFFCVTPDARRPSSLCTHIK
jgi:hypothetical protein